MGEVSIVVKRVRLLAEQIAPTLKTPPGARGHEQKLAAKLGISPSMLSKLRPDAERPKSHLQDDTILAIIDTLGLDPAFLFDKSLGDEPDHRDWIRKRAKPAPIPEPPHWAEFAKRWSRYKDLTPRERESLRFMLSSDDHEISDWTAWISLAEAVLGRRRKR